MEYMKKNNEGIINIISKGTHIKPMSLNEFNTNNN